MYSGLNTAFSAEKINELKRLQQISINSHTGCTERIATFCKYKLTRDMQSTHNKHLQKKPEIEMSLFCVF